MMAAGSSALHSVGSSVCVLKSGFAREGLVLSRTHALSGRIRYFLRLQDGTTEWFCDYEVFPGLC